MVLGRDIVVQMWPTSNVLNETRFSIQIFSSILQVTLD